jgi:hypothetical protein
VHTMPIESRQPIHAGTAFDLGAVAAARSAPSGSPGPRRVLVDNHARRGQDQPRISVPVPVWRQFAPPGPELSGYRAAALRRRAWGSSPFARACTDTSSFAVPRPAGSASPPAPPPRSVPEPAALSWLATHWGVTDRLRQVAVRGKATTGRRLPNGHAVIGYGFFTAGETPHAAIGQFEKRWPEVRFFLQPRPAA